MHAAAVIKAVNRGDAWLADRVYSGVPASWFGRVQEIEIGHQSGLSNIRYWLKRRGIEESEELVQAIFKRAKDGSEMLADEDVMNVVKAFQAN